MWNRIFHWNTPIQLVLNKQDIGCPIPFLNEFDQLIKDIKLGSNGKPREIPHQSMVPHSTRGLMFSHWLAGRRDLHWCVLRKLPQLIDLSSYGDVYDWVRKNRIKNGRKTLMSCITTVLPLCTISIALFTIQDNWRVPTKTFCSLIRPYFVRIWQLLYALVVLEKTTRPSLSYDKSVETVKSKLSSSNLRHENTLANLYDFNNVTRRTIASLHDTGQLGDVSNSTRMEAIQTRHYLVGDFEDHRFHTDWTLVQMYSSTARILRRHVKDSSDLLLTSTIRTTHSYFNDNQEYNDLGNRQN